MNPQYCSVTNIYTIPVNRIHILYIVTLDFLQGTKHVIKLPCGAGFLPRPQQCQFHVFPLLQSDSQLQHH